LISLICCLHFLYLRFLSFRHIAAFHTLVIFIIFLHSDIIFFSR